MKIDKNHRRDLRLRADRALDEIVTALAEQLRDILQDPNRDPSVKIALAPALLAMLKDAKDLIQAEAWSKDLKAAVLLNPRILDMAPGGASTHKIAAAATRVLKALKVDQRVQAERKVREARRFDGLPRVAGNRAGAVTEPPKSAEA